MGMGWNNGNAHDEARPRTGGPAGVDRGGRENRHEGLLSASAACGGCAADLVAGRRWGIDRPAQTQASNAQHPDPWPREMHIDGGTMTVYEPQVDSWDGGFLKFRAAVAVKPDGGRRVFGIVRASAHTLVDNRRAW